MTISTNGNVVKMTVRLGGQVDVAERHAKRRKHHPSGEADADGQDVHVVPVHPFGVQPSGNALLKDSREMADHCSYLRRSMGPLHRLADAVLIDILSRLDPKDLVHLGAASRALLAYTSHESLWKEALLRTFDRKLRTWNGSWKATLVAHLSEEAAIDSAPVLSSSTCLFSDELYLPLQLASLPLGKYDSSSRSCRGIEHVSMSCLSKQDFYERYARPGRPCLMTTEGAQRAEVPDWQIEDIRRIYAGRRIRAEALTMQIDTYAAYARTCADWERNRCGWIPDESPFYLFDPVLARAMQRDGQFIVPPIFREDGEGADKGTMAFDWDLFGLLKDRRPDNAWIIAGPRRSGSGWHVDPNRTSAYNTVLSGRKLWMLLPPHITPPGVFISEDAGTITAPLSIAEWLTDFWQPCLRQHGKARGGDDTLLVDVCGPGETIYVPAGWKHLVINLDESVAFTQNFVTPAELPALLDFMKNTPDQISGFRIRKERHSASDDSGSDPEYDELDDGGISEKKKLFSLFVERLRAHNASLCEKGLEGTRELEKVREQSCKASKSHELISGKARTAGQENGWWQSLKKQADKGTVSQFAVALGDGEDLDDVPW